MGPGWQHARASTVFIRLEEGSQQSAFEELADSPPAHKTGATQHRLRGVFEAVSRESCLDENVTFDIVGYDFGISFWFLRLAVII